MTGGSLWPIIASLAMQGTPGDGASPPAAEPPAPAADPSLGDLTPPPPPVEWQKMVGDDLVTQLLEAFDARYPGRNLKIGSNLAERSEEHTSELQSLMRISYAVFCLKKKKLKPERTHLRTTTHELIRRQPTNPRN